MPNFDYGNDVETAVTDTLPHVFHPMFVGWRVKANVLIEGLRNRGFEIVPREEEPDAAK